MKALLALTLGVFYPVAICFGGLPEDVERLRSLIENRNRLALTGPQSPSQPGAVDSLDDEIRTLRERLKDSGEIRLVGFARSLVLTREGQWTTATTPTRDYSRIILDQPDRRFSYQHAGYQPSIRRHPDAVESFQIIRVWRGNELAAVLHFEKSSLRIALVHVLSGTDAQALAELLFKSLRGEYQKLNTAGRFSFFAGEVTIRFEMTLNDFLYRLFNDLFYWGSGGFEQRTGGGGGSCQTRIGYGGSGTGQISGTARGQIGGSGQNALPGN